MIKRLLTVLALLILPALAAPAVTWYVSTNGSDTTYTGTNAWTNAFLTITNAVVKSSAGDLILVSNGTYYATGPGVVSSGTNFIYINKAITLKSFSGNPEDTILHGNGMTNRLVLMYAKGSVLDGFTLTNGYPGGYNGGGLLVYDSALITNCIITGCRSDVGYGGGGGVCLSASAGNGVITMAWCRVIGNTAPYTYNVQCGGGGIYCSSNSTVAMFVTNCDIGYNSIGAGEGGGICGSRNVRIYNSRIFGNTVVSNAGQVYGGGGISWWYGGPYLKDCFISNNIQTNYTGYGAYGGGAKNCILDHCWVLNNTGYDGGGAWGCIVSNGSLLAGNYAVANGGGHRNGSIYDSTVSNNTAATGAGVYLNGSGVISNCLIVNNRTTTGNGGGVWMYNDTGYEEQLQNCVIMNNAANDGAGVYLTRNNPLGVGMVANCLVVRNSAAHDGGGVYASYSMESSFRVVSCTIASNYATRYAGGFYVADTMTVSNSIICSNLAGSAYPNITVGSSHNTNNFNYCLVRSSGLGGVGNLTNADPKFVNFDGADYHLAADSPAINAGTNQAWMYLRQDLDNTNSRIINGRVDIGCYEYTDGALSVTFGANTNWALAPSTNIFTAIVSGTNLDSLTYSWDFTADGAPDLEGSDLAVVTSVYAAAGYYSVALNVSNAIGQTAGITNMNYIKAGPLTYYVATNGACQAPYTNWAQAATDIYWAVAQANDGDTVLVSNGVYFATTAYGGKDYGYWYIPLNCGVTVRSLNGPEFTSVTRYPAKNDRIFVLNHKNSAVIGFTLTNGFTTGPYGTPLRAYGGAIFMYGGLVSNCVIARNTVTNGGGGIYMNGGLVANSVIRDNLCSNMGAGILIANYGAVRNCLIVSNRVTSGVAALALRGGGIYFSGGGTAENCTVVGNLASNAGGGVFCTNGGRVLNSIIISNSTLSGLSSNWYTNGSAAISFSNCCVIPTNDLTGTGHIQAEPLFVDYANDNFRLAAGSPCLDTGTNQAHWMPAGIDLDGQNRIFNTVVDIGAFERSLFDAAAAPASVQASDGTYVDQVLVTWETNACTNATGYQVFRSLAADPAGADQLSDVSDPSYADTSATNGVIYYYWVRATNAYAVSDLSASNTGWRAIVPPTGVTASDGTVTGKVVVTWETNVCTNATGYYVWRNDSNDAASALNLAAVVGTNYDDTSARSNVSYYYWLQATNATGPGGTNSFSAPDTGYWAQWYYVATNGDDSASGIDWSAPLLTVSNGVMLAQRWAGGGVLVSNGEYTLAATNIFITNAITVRSWNNGALDAAGTVVDGNLATRCFRISHGSAVVDSLTIRNGTNAVSGGGVYLENGAQLLNCIVSSNYAPDGAGIYVADGTVMGCTIQYNLAFTNQSLEPTLAPSRGGGVFLYRNGTISNCVIVGNLVSNTYVSGANYSGGGGIGIHTVASGDRCRVYSSLVSNNFSWSAGGGIFWRAQQEGLDQILFQSCTNVNNEALGSGGGFGCYSPGTGGTITGGVIMANVATNGWGGGIYVLSGLGPRVGDSLIRGNKAFSGGGAAGVSLFNCTVESNTCYSTSYAGGGIYLPATRLVVSNCVIRGNRSEGVGNVRGGAGIELVGGLGGNNLVVDCRIYDNYSANYGGGVHCRANNPGLHTQLLHNCVVYGNVAVRGGGIFLNTTGAMVSACTIVSNRASSYGGGVYLANGYVTNGVIYSNDCATAGWKDLYAAAAGLTNNLGYCCISTNIESGLHNITNEPVFLNFAAQNYRLASGSAGINIGTNQDWMWWATDKDGNPRVLGGIADLGAYEYPLYPQVSPLGITNTLISGFSTGTLVQLWSGDTNVELNYAASSTYAWIALGISNGVIAANMTNTLWVTNDSTGLAAGTYTGAVLVVATNSLSALYPPDTQTVTVIMTILPMGPPANVQATDGAYADKVVVTWETNLCTNATGYAVWRSISADTNSASILSAASDTSYIDTSAANGVLYYYWVQATNADCFSDLSESNTGYRALAPPTGITASDGTYTGKVVVTWQTNMCTNAVGYSVWRNTADNLTSATRLVGVVGTNYDDTSAMSNVSYYYWIQATNTLSQTNISAGGPDTGYWALWYYVATNGSDANPGLDWTAPAASISNAVTNASHCGGGGVFVSNGTYALTAQISVTTNLAIRSWNNGDFDPTNTVVDGQRFDRCFYVNNSAALVAGFTIRNGSNTFGGGVCIAGGGGTVSNCIITDNLVDQGAVNYQGGGGVYMTGTVAAVKNCVIQRNQRLEDVTISGGAGVTLSSGGLLKDCEIIYNTNSVGAAGGGGGVFVYNGGTMDNCLVISNVAGANIAGAYLLGNNILVTNCLVAANACTQAVASSGIAIGGLKAEGGTGIVITDCVISNNTCTGNRNAQSGGMLLACAALVRNCQIVNNTSPAGNKKGGLCLSGNSTVLTSVVRGNAPGGVSSDQNADGSWRLISCLIVGNSGNGVETLRYPNIINCTIVSNTGTGLKDYNAAYPTTGQVVNSIVYLNRTANYTATVNDQFFFTNSCTTPLPPLGAGNFTDDPAFVNPNAANFRLQPGSACINAGTNDVWMDTAFDLQGRPRIRYGRVDVGCYEYWLNVKVNGVPIDRILRLNGVNQNRIFRINQ